MKKNNKSGVTLTLLVITIIVMLILFGVTFSTSTELLRNSQKNKMKTMLYMVQSRAEILLDDYLFEYEDKLTSTTESEIEDSLKGNYITNVNDLKNVGYESGSTAIPSKETIIYCSWNESVLKSQGIDTENLAEGDTIVIQYNITDEKVDVASTKGYSEDGVSIHSLSDF